MSSFNQLSLCFFAISFTLFVGNSWSEEKGEGSGAFIFISSQGEVKFLDGENQPKPMIGVGSIIPKSYVIETGGGSQLVGLLSNGTLLTLTEMTRMRVSSFKQQPFEDDGRKLSELPGEPSKSEIMLDLDFGSLVVKTKKLNKSSSFEIMSPLGVAGIRGTEFQMSSSSEQGVQLDVTESTVAFTPPGGGQAIAVSQGGGLSVSSSGVATQRPVNPVVATKIESTNQAATEATQDVSLGEVVVAVEQSSVQEQESETAESEGESSEENTESEVEEDAQGEESTESEEDSSGEESAGEESAGEESAGEESAGEESSLEETQETVESEETPMEEEKPSDTGSEESSSGADESVPVEDTPSEAVNESEPTSSEPEVETEGVGTEPVSTESSGETAGVSTEPVSTEPVESVSSVPAESVASDAQVSKDPAPSTSSQPSGGSQTESPQVGSVQKGSGVISKKEGIAVAKPKTEVVQPDQSQLLENNPELKKNQKLSKYGLDAEELSRYDRLSILALEQIEQESPAVVKRLLGIVGFEGEKSKIFFEHDRELRDLLLGVSDGVLITLLDREVDEVLLRESLQKIKQGLVKPGDVPVNLPEQEINNRVIALGDLLKEHDNGEVMEKLLEMSGGVLDKEIVRIGEVAEVLTRNLELTEFTGLEGFTREEALGNPFFPELANVYDELELESLVNGVDLVMGADRWIVQENAEAFGSHFSQGVDEIVIMSRELLEFRGDLILESKDMTDTRLVLMSADQFTVREGVSLHSATSDLVLATRRNLLLKQVDLEAAREVTIRGMRDVTLNQVKIGADELARIKARRDLTVDGLSFKRDVSRIVMEATTLRLSNVNFPGASQVRLNSLKGGVDGRYPNFGRSIPAVQQVGRVNFIENIKSGGNLLHDRPSFDQYGKNINIGKIARP
jgi:hypothetical protein